MSEQNGGEWYQDGNYVRNHQRQVALAHCQDEAVAETIVRDHNAAAAEREARESEIAALQDELAFQTKNAADAHHSRAHQFRRAADALDLLAQAVAEDAHSTTCKVIANGRSPDACDCCMAAARAALSAASREPAAGEG